MDEEELEVVDVVTEEPVVDESAQESAQETTTSEPNEEVKEKQTRKSSKEFAKEALEKELEDDEKADEFIRDFASKSQALNKQLLEIFDENPEVGATLAKMTRDGIPFLEALAEFVTPEELQEALDSSDKGKEALKTRKEQIAKEKAFLKQVEANQELSEKALTSFMTKHQMDEPAVNEFFKETVLPVTKRLVDQNFDEEFFEMMLKSHNYKRDMKEAETIAEVRGLNKKIVTEKDTKKSDGLPKITGGGINEIAQVAERKISSIGRIAQQNEEERNRIR